MSFTMGKRGQITVFIIIALVLLGSVVLYFYLKEHLAFFRPEVIVPTELLPLDMYIKDCVYSSAKDAVIRIGNQGGFVEVPEEIKAQRAAYIALDPWGEFVLPFWSYRGNVRYPTLKYLEFQISEYVENNIDSCFRNFIDFRNDYDIKTFDKYRMVTTQLLDDYVRVELKYPMTVSDKATTKKSDLEMFAANLNVKLKEAHQVAEKIILKEIEDLYFENLTINLMALHPDIPFTEMRFECGSKQWYLEDIERETKDLLYLTLPRIRVKNTKYSPFEGAQEQYDELELYDMEDIQNYYGLDENKAENDVPYDIESMPDDFWEYLRLFWEIGLEENSDMRVSFSYRPEYSMELMAYPSKNGVLKERSAKGASEFLRWVCINMYHFVYDVRFPIKVSVRDDHAFDETGYVFSFAMPVNIYHNLPDKETISVKAFEGGEPTEGFCESVGTDDVEIVAKGFYDGLTNTEIPGVNISYVCFREFCELGTTQYNDGHDSLITKLPKGCANPLLTAKKEGYLDAKAQIITGQDFLEIPMKSMKKLNYTIQRHPYNSKSKKLDVGYGITEGESGVIRIEELATGNEQFLFFNASYITPGNVEFVEEGGRYNLHISFMRKGYTSTNVVGGYFAENISISGVDIAGKKIAVFHAFDYQPEPVTDSETIALSNYLFNGDYKQILKPTFI